MKRFLTLCFAIMLTGQAMAGSFTIGNLMYTITGANTVSVGQISQYNKPDGDLVIPAEVENEGVKYAVTALDRNAFFDCNDVTSVTIPNSVTTIGAFAFEDCYSLTEINVESSNKQYESENGVLFNKGKTTIVRYPAGKIGTYTIPNSVTSIGEYAFECCNGITSVTIPNSVTSIGDCALVGCSKLAEINVESANTKYASEDGVLFDKKKVAIVCCPAGKTGAYTIPNSVRTIGDYAFFGCICLTSVTIPQSYTTIGKNAFLCVKNIVYGDSATGKPWGALTVNGIIDGDFIYSDNAKKNLTAYIGNGGNVVIPNLVRTIGNFAFYNCCNLTSVSIPNSVTSIGESAFRGCSGLTSVTIGNSVTSIGVCAFEYCSSLTSVTIPNSVTTIDAIAFKYCSGLTSVSIPNSVTRICEGAFSYCRCLTSVNIPSSVTSISSYAFSGCIGLISVNIPSSVTSISSYAFSGCSGLTSVTIPNSVTSIGNGAFQYCSGLTSVTISNSVTSIGNGAFSSCSKLTEINVESANTKYTSENGVLFNKDKTTIVCYPAGKTGTYTIPNSVTSIGNEAFGFCSNLTSVNIPNSVTSIGSYAFYNCSGLTSIVYDGTRAPTIGTDAFKSVNSSVKVCVPENYTSEYFGGFSVYKGHNKETDQAVSPTCTETGLTEGVHCSNCGRVFVAQQEIAATGHSYSTAVTAPTCTEIGFTTHSCTVCDYTYNSDTIAAQGHTEVADAAVAATCTAAGKTEGKHCSVCHTVLVAQEVIPAGHKADSVVFENVVAATRTAAGSYDSVVYCSVCRVELSRTTVNVPQILAESIKLASKPNKVEYKQGEALDVKGGKITIGYTDKSTEDFEILAGWVSGFDSQKVGEQKLTITFESVSSTLTTTFNVTVSKEDDNTAIDEDAANAVNIYAYQNVIVVENADAEIYVYDAMGRLVERNIGNNSRTEIRMNNAGVYIVKVGNTAKRVMVK